MGERKKGEGGREGIQEGRKEKSEAKEMLCKGI